MSIDFAFINHPVHIVTSKAKLSPSALIPFCEFGGGNMSTMGIKIDQFKVPVCNVFQAKIINGQLCYEVDLNKFSYEKEKEVELGLNFLMDYNEDRQVTFDRKIKVSELDLTNSLVESNQDQHAFIYLDTVGNY